MTNESIADTMGSDLMTELLVTDAEHDRFSDDGNPHCDSFPSMDCPKAYDQLRVIKAEIQEHDNLYPTEKMCC